MDQRIILCLHRGWKLLEIINYYMEELRKYGWEFVAEEDNVEKSNGKKWKKNIYFLMERMSFNYLFL